MRRLRTWLSSKVVTALRIAGWDLVPFPPVESDEVRRARLLSHHGIDLVIDVGGNRGRYGQSLRQLGYAGRIVSFEPLSEAFAMLSDAARRDPEWEVKRLALGERDETAAIHVAANLHSSSLLEMKPRHLQSAPDSAYVGVEDVSIQKLEGIWESIVRPGERVWLKIDTQGFELPVLKGTGAVLDAVTALEIELSLVELYGGQPLWREVMAWLEERGFRLEAIEPGFSDPDSGRMLQMDGVFVHATGRTRSTNSSDRD